MSDFQDLANELYADYPEYSMLPYHQQAQLQFLWTKEQHGNAWRDVLHEQLWDADGQFPDAASVLLLFWEWLKAGPEDDAEYAAERLKYRAIQNMNVYGAGCAAEYNRNYSGDKDEPEDPTSLRQRFEQIEAMGINR